jgi:hypothetical protein
LQEANQELLMDNDIFVLAIDLSSETLQVVNLLLHSSISLRTNIVHHPDELSKARFVRCGVSVHEGLVNCSWINEVVN